MTVASKSWPGRATQADRRAARRSIVLADIGVAENTLQRYYTAVARLAPVLAKPCTVEELDEMVSRWVETEFEDGAPLYLVADALSGPATTFHALCQEEAGAFMEVILHLASL